jgi:hypothetical protein
MECQDDRFFPVLVSGSGRPGQVAIERDQGLGRAHLDRVHVVVVVVGYHLHHGTQSGKG